MRLLFVYQAIAAITEKPRLTPRIIATAGHNVAVFDGACIFYREGKARYEDNISNQYFIEVSPDLYAVIGLFSGDEVFLSRIAGLPDGQIAKFVADSLDIAADTSAYTARAGSRIAEQREARKIEDARIDAERKEKRERAERERIERAVSTFKAGEFIDWDEFEELCKLHGVTMAIQTIGSGRKRVSKVGNGKFMVQRGFTPNGVFSASRELAAKLA
jgi:hypothetical protein